MGKLLQSTILLTRSMSQTYMLLPSQAFPANISKHKETGSLRKPVHPIPLPTSNISTMVLTSSQTGIIIPAISGVVISLVIISALVFGCNLPFTFSHRKPAPARTDIEVQRISTDAESTEGEYEQYGELFIAPNKQPTHAAIDIISRVAMAHGLPGPAKPKSCPDSMHRHPPRVSLDLPTSTHLSVAEQNHESSKDTLSTERRSMDDVTAQLKAERIRSGERAEVAKDEVSKVSEDVESSFGHGKGMANLYGK